jgi:hypothetical protein
MIMFRTIALAVALGSLALPAAAASVKVNIAGLDAKSAHEKIVRAAEQACNAVLQDSAIARYYEMTPCVDDAVAVAEAKFAANDHHYASVQSTGR